MENLPPASGPSEDPAGRSERHALDAVRAALRDDFEILRTLGRGKMASVYLARDRMLGVLVAIKVLNAEQARDETVRRRFEREARAAASLAEHPNVVAVQRFGRLPDQRPYLIMQYVKGRTMEERLKAEGRLSMAEAKQVIREVASALEVAHANGFLHRDVRPANILWDEEHRRALLTDFGIAAILASSGEETTRLTRTGQLMGELRYLSPEQLHDAELTEMADVYLLGVLGYELLTGEGPYVARSNTDWITAHLRQEPRDLRTLRPDVDAATADLLKRCLAKEPMHRPSAADVVRILEGRTGGGADSQGESVGGDLAELVKRRVPQIVLVAIGGAITLIGLADALEDLMPPDSKLLTVVFSVAGVVASAVVAWFHGERGEQRAPVIEYLLLGLIAAAWLVVSGWIIVTS